MQLLGRSGVQGVWLSPQIADKVSHERLHTRIGACHVGSSVKAMPAIIPPTAPATEWKRSTAAGSEFSLQAVRSESKLQLVHSPDRDAPGDFVTDGGCRGTLSSAVFSWLGSWNQRRIDAIDVIQRS